MSAAEAFLALDAAGLSIRSDGDRVALSPAERVTPGVRNLVRANITDLVHFVGDAQSEAAALLRKAMRRDAAPVEGRA